MQEKDEEEDEDAIPQVDTIAELGFDGQILNMVLEAGHFPGDAGPLVPSLHSQPSKYDFFDTVMSRVPVFKPIDGKERADPCAAAPNCAVSPVHSYRVLLPL